MAKSLFKNLRDFIRWHKPSVVSTMSRIEEHFDLSLDEIAMIEACIRHKLIKEYVFVTEDKSEAYIVLKVSEVRKLLKLKRKNERH